MAEKQEFSFGGGSVANDYDTILVPFLFKPWAEKLATDFQPWEGKSILDLATGTGILAETLSGQIGQNGNIIAVDINGEMLALAAKHCEGKIPKENFIESPAYPMDVESNSFDVVVCQQGFQFFPDKKLAVAEIKRVLKDNGKVILTTWCSVDECILFGLICKALEKVGQDEISEHMQIPFNGSLETELPILFESGGFTNVKCLKQEKDFVMSGGVEQGIQLAYSTPIGPKLRELSEEKQEQFKEILTDKINSISADGTTMGKMVTNQLSAEK